VLSIASDGVTLSAGERTVSSVSKALKPAAVVSGLTFPNRQVVPNKPAGFA